MPAALYVLAGRPHPAAAQAPEAQVVEQPAPAVPEPTVSAPELPALADEVTNQAPVWDASWTKSQLLEVASQLQLTVTSANTKAQIIEALTAAT